MKTRIKKSPGEVSDELSSSISSFTSSETEIGSNSTGFLSKPSSVESKTTSSPTNISSKISTPKSTSVFKSSLVSLLTLTAFGSKMFCFFLGYVRTRLGYEHWATSKPKQIINIDHNITDVPPERPLFANAPHQQSIIFRAVLLKTVKVAKTIDAHFANDQSTAQIEKILEKKFLVYKYYNIT